jgi:hypothetical protein
MPRGTAAGRRDLPATPTAARPCHRDCDQRARARTGEVVQSAAWFRLPDPRRGRTRHFRAYGDLAPLRLDRVAAGPVRPRSLWTRGQGTDGGRGAARGCAARPGFSLNYANRSCLPLQPFSTRPTATRPRVLHRPAGLRLESRRRYPHGFSTAASSHARGRGQLAACHSSAVDRS